MTPIFSIFGLVEQLKNIIDTVTNSKLLLFTAGVLSYPLIKYTVKKVWHVSIKLATYIIHNRQLIKAHISRAIIIAVKYISLLPSVFAAVKNGILYVRTKIFETKQIKTSEDGKIDSIFSYGAVELKASYQKYMTVGLSISMVIHVILIWLILIQNEPKEAVRVVRIKKYAETESTKTMSKPPTRTKRVLSYFSTSTNVPANISQNVRTFQSPFSQAELTYEGLLQTNIRVVDNPGLSQTGASGPATNVSLGGPIGDILSQNYKVVGDETQNIGQGLASTEGLFSGPGGSSSTANDQGVYIPGGSNLEGNGDNIAGGSITSDFGDGSYLDNVGSPTNIPITRKTKKQILPDNPEPFEGEIKWEEVLDPIFDWINKNAGPIGQVCTMKLTNNDPTAKTAKLNIVVANTTYELLLASKEEKQQLTICLVNLITNKFVMLFDQGATKQSSIFNIGKVRRDQNNEINSFSKSTYKSANDPEAQEFTNIFWQWANTVTGQD